MQTPSISVRPLVRDDVAIYRELRLRGLLESPEAFGSSHVEEAAMSLTVVADRMISLDPATPKVTLGAFLDDRLVGTVGCSREARVKTRHKATIWGMYVSPEARGTGIGRRLVERAIEEARQWPGVDRITLTVVTRAAAARRLYHRIGFRPFGLEPDGLRQDGECDVVEYLSFDLHA